MGWYARTQVTGTSRDISFYLETPRATTLASAERERGPARGGAVLSAFMLLVPLFPMCDTLFPTCISCAGIDIMHPALAHLARQRIRRERLLHECGVDVEDAVVDDVPSV